MSGLLIDGAESNVVGRRGSVVIFGAPNQSFSTILLVSVSNRKVVTEVRTVVSLKMSKLLLITDSNFINNVQAFKGRKIKNLEVKSCQSRRTIMQEVHTMDEGIMVLSCLDMLASEIVKSTANDPQAAVEHQLTQLFYTLTAKAEEADGKLTIGVMSPLFWTSLSEETRRTLNHVYKTMKKTSVPGVWISGYFRDIQAGADGTHLTSRSAARFIQHTFDFFALIGMASNLGRPELEPEAESTNVAPVDWSEEMAEQDSDAVSLLAPPDDRAVVSPARTTSALSMSILDMSGNQASYQRPPIAMGSTQLRLLQLAGGGIDFSVPPPVVSAQPPATIGDIGVGLFKLEQRVGVLEAKTFYDSLMMASLKEEQDTEANIAMINRVTISGVVIDGLVTMKDVDKVTAMKAKVSEYIDFLKEDGQEFQVLFVRHLNKQIRGQKSAVIEVKFPDDKQAKMFRANFVKKQKELSEKINVTPVVRLATRVRVELLHSIANLYSRRDQTVIRALCLQYLPKPVIKIVRKNNAGVEVSRTMTFIEAVCWAKVEGGTRQLDLKKAYDRAGASFRGTLNQHFVLLD